MIQWPHTSARAWEDRGAWQALLDFEECLEGSSSAPLETMPLKGLSLSLWSTTLTGRRLLDAQERAVRGYEMAWERLLRVRKLLAPDNS